MNEEQIRKKIEGMFEAVFGKTDKDRNDFLKLSKPSQDLLIGNLEDSIVKGYIGLLKDLELAEKKP